MIKIPQTVSYDKVERQYELDVSGAYYITVPAGWVMKERFIDPGELISVVRGRLRVNIGGQEFTIGESEVLIARRYTLLSGKVEGGEPCSFYSVSFNSTIEKYHTLYSRVIRLQSRAPFAQSLLGNINYYSSRGAGHSYLRDSAMALLLDTVYEAASTDSERFRIHGIIDYINDNISTSLNIEEISDHFHYSHDYIAKLFKQEFDVTMKQYIIERKLTVAKRLLVTSEMPVEQVGQAIGFPDIALFEKFFKYHVGQTPKKYRNEYK